jgi:beta-lactamase regulating signal transducer with metallopeptidase domain/Flp pilus assembly protein TadD
MATLFELAARIQAAGGGESLLLILAKATLILAIARLLLAVIPRASAATRHVVATAALVGVAAMPVLTLVIPAWNVVVARATAPPAPPAPAVQQNKIIGALDEESTPTPSPSPSPAINSALNIAKASGVVKEERLTAMARMMSITRTTWKGLIVVALDIVALLMLAQMLLGVLGVWYVAKRAEEVTHDDALLELDRARDQLALERDVRLLRSSRISVPVLWGFFKPVLLLPADVVTWPVERIRVVLLHELAHLKRFDGISLILTRIAACVFWYHPLAWSLERAGRNDCERACDDLVLASGTKPSDYADHLLAIARSMPTFDPFRSVTLAMSRKSQLEGRLLSILQPHVVRSMFGGRRVAVACAVVVACLIPLSAIRLIAEPSKEKHQLIAEKKHDEQKIKTDSTVTVTPEVEALEDYVLAKLGKYDKRLDQFAREPRDGEEWYERAYNYYHNDRYPEAAVAFRRAAQDDYRKATSLYNAACSYALANNTDAAILALKEAIDAGWDDMDKIADDSDFDPIRSDPKFARAMSAQGGEIATRRVNEVVQRYEDLRVGKTVTKKDKDDFHFDFDGKEDNNEWFQAGYDLLRLRKLDDAIDAFQHSIDAGEKESTSMYNIACAYSLKGDVANGMASLSKAVDLGFDSDDKFESDPDIARLREQRGFDELRQKAKDFSMRGCCDDDSDKNDREQWRDLMEHHRAMTQKYPTSGRPWFNLGFAALQARDFNTGIDAFQRAIQLHHRIGTSSYNIACGYALKGDRNSAFAWLEKARDAGFDLRGHMKGDDDLDALHDDPRWDALLDDLRARRR